METYIKTNQTHLISDLNVETVDDEKNIENVIDKNKGYFECDLCAQGRERFPDQSFRNRQRSFSEGDRGRAFGENEFQPRRRRFVGLSQDY
ncbi:hypothetical protein AVEN_169987-1 [Araneus ventricosus]|uniref:Uncharacterized protein n=1 Tax=Araneus ventricosus TaxID=182803 RepID=A0A4Y2KL34_ARAVE|nr:hypothetical protein AVEN_169987-1 [Araneus ventricosus]